MKQHMDFNKLLTVTFTLFAVIDIIGSIPVLIGLRNKAGKKLHWCAAHS
ncbi:MAG TPA: hypothetical protein VEV62_06750 [Parafilimonas sp.]|nr:hypothetical protein [Parafilimonas sp.]